MATSRRRSFGYVRKLPSGRFQASYLAGDDRQRYIAPTTFLTKPDAEAWLATEQAKLIEGRWRPPAVEVAAKSMTLATYAETWLANRDVRPRTRTHYRSLLDDHILATFGDRELDAVKPAEVAAWHVTVAKGTPTLRSHAYGLLRTIFNTAVAEDLVEANPCRVRGAGNTKRVKKMKPATLDELAAITAAMPPRYQLMVLLAAWGALRFGEVTELRRKDIDVKTGVIHVRRGVVHTDGQCVIGDPKSDAGKRDVTIPPHLMPLVTAHLLEHTGPGRDGLLFVPACGGCHILPSTLYKVYYPARDKAGRTDLRFHDLRHTGATLAAATGATLAEVMARLGHSTVGAAMRYQHAAADRDKAIAEALSKLAMGNHGGAAVVDLDSRRTTG